MNLTIKIDKIGSDNPNSDGYYANIERVLEKQRAERLGYSEGQEIPEEEDPDGGEQGL